MLDLMFIEQCSQAIEPEMIQAVISIESSGNPLALNVNKKDFVIEQTPKDKHEAIVLARQLIEAGLSVDIGLMQVNSQHLGAMNINVDELFDECTNIQIGSQILAKAHNKALKRYGDTPFSMLAALSAYNTGDFAKGFSNGYVARYFNNRAIDIKTENPYHATTFIAFDTKNHSARFINQGEK